MKQLFVIAGSAMLVMAGVAAANSATPAATTNAGPVIQNSQAMASADQAGKPVNMRQQITDQLTKDGYTGVTVMPSSFYVRAKDKAGNAVAMVIGPDSFTEVTDVMPKMATDATPAPKAGGTDDPTPVAAQK